MSSIIAVAGGTGALGGRIIKALLILNVDVRAIVRKETNLQKVQELETLGVTVFKVDMLNVKEVAIALKDVACVVSALAGLENVIIDTQKVLLDGAIAAGVPRFIPSDFSIDFTPFSYGENRNLDLRRTFHKYLDAAPIKTTSIFNGAFAELVTNEMPLILFKQKIVLYWASSNQKYLFTTMDDTAWYTAKAALDFSTPRYLRIAGDSISPKEIQALMLQVTGKKFRLFRPGGKGLLSIIIKIAKKISPSNNELYPAWQGMQYMRNMIDERAIVKQLDNDRYKGLRWTTIKDVVKDYLKK